MNPLEIISLYYPPGARLTQILVRHSEQVRDRALDIARQVPHLSPDLDFISQAAMLHDIGIRETDSPNIQCHGPHPYIRHGIIGKQMLHRHGLDDHGLVCERHVGVGISKSDVQSHGFPLPVRDMLPTTTEEIIICYADKFYSKTNGGRPHSLEKVIAGLQRYGTQQVDRFMMWHNMLAI